MIAYAAIDVRGGRVVQLVGGRVEAERVSLPDATAVARRWIEAGFAALHVVDLDGALGAGGNGAAVEAVVREANVAGVLVQVGGGVRDDEAVAALLEAGADRVIVGTRAIEQPEWLESLAARHPGRIVLAADTRGGEAVAAGWTRRTGTRVAELLARADALPLAAVLVTDVDREGRMKGADVARFREYAGATRHPLLAAGGIATIDDVRALREAGAAGAVLGMALYTGGIGARAAAREFGRAPADPRQPTTDR